MFVIDVTSTNPFHNIKSDTFVYFGFNSYERVCNLTVNVLTSTDVTHQLLICLFKYEVNNAKTLQFLKQIFIEFSNGSYINWGRPQADIILHWHKQNKLHHTKLNNKLYQTLSLCCCTVNATICIRYSSWFIQALPSHHPLPCLLHFLPCHCYTSFHNEDFMGVYDRNDIHRVQRCTAHKSRPETFKHLWERN